LGTGAEGLALVLAPQLLSTLLLVLVLVLLLGLVLVVLVCSWCW
jgi:hypothetical protein